MVGRGYFIAVSGIEGAGKTSQVKPLGDYLTQKGHNVIIAREPGGTEIGKKIRAVILDPEFTGRMDPLTEMLLYQADRAQQYSQIVLPNLYSGKHVISDRCFVESIIYQGIARGLSLGVINHLNQITTRNTPIDLLYIIDGDPETLLKNAWKDLSEFGEKDRMEREALEFHQKLREGFLDFAQRNSFAVVINHRQDDEEGMQEEIRYHLKERLKI
ncbi:MAG: dTMP kinase [Nanoarchaeota archaeon]